MSFSTIQCPEIQQYIHRFCALSPSPKQDTTCHDLTCLKPFKNPQSSVSTQKNFRKTKEGLLVAVFFLLCFLFSEYKECRRIEPGRFYHDQSDGKRASLLRGSPHSSRYTHHHHILLHTEGFKIGYSKKILGTSYFLPYATPHFLLPMTYLPSCSHFRRPMHRVLWDRNCWD